MARHVHVLPTQELLRHVEQAGVGPEAPEGRGQPRGLVQEDGCALEMLLEGVHPVCILCMWWWSGMCVVGIWT